MGKSAVYFTKDLSSEGLMKLFNKLNPALGNNTAIKVHSGEKGNQNFLKPLFWKELIDKLDGTVVECNTAYPGARDTVKHHMKLLKEHEWTKYFKFDLLDAEEPDLVFDIPNGKVLKVDYLGKNLANYDSLLVLSHFKGHPMGGFGGALKQLSIGCASSRGKAYIHSGGFTTDPSIVWDHTCSQIDFLEAMADAASVVHNHFKGHVAYINVMKNMSVDCDCCAVAEDPCLKDIGILASIDPIAIDQACIDLVKVATDDPGQAHFLERVNSRKGEHILEAAYDLGFGSREYQLINIDE